MRLPRQYLSIKNGPLPADGPGSDSFSNTALISLLVGGPLYLTWKIGAGFKTFVFFALLVDLPILAAWWLVVSAISPRRNEKAKLPGRPVEYYLNFKRESDRAKYRGSNKIPMETFHELYFDGHVDFKGDCLDVMEYRHDWASFRFTIGLIRHFLLGMIPELIMHTRSQGMSGPAVPGRRLTRPPQTRSRSGTTTTAATTSTAGSWALA